jgi:hypothetical protein
VSPLVSIPDLELLLRSERHILEGLFKYLDATLGPEILGRLGRSQRRVLR